MRIFVGGSLRDVEDVDSCRRFIAALGRAVVEKKHVLLNGCRNQIDKEIAEAAQHWLIDNKRDPKHHVISYWQRDAEPAHNYGTVRASALPDWKMSHAELRVPEQIENADVTFFVGGGEGTYTARNWAHWARKPILGVARFGGAGFQIYLQERNRLRAVDRDQGDAYELLNQVGSDLTEYARDLVVLSERLLVPSNVFIVMPFEGEWDDVWEVFRTVCDSHGFHADRTDKSLSQERINQRIEAGIAKSAFVIADVSRASPNVFFEVGFARGCGKHVIVTAEDGTSLPFDLVDVPVLFWRNHDELAEGLRKRIAAFKSVHQSAETDLA